MVEFSNNDPHVTDTKCESCGSVVMETINEDSPVGMSALNDGYDYQCGSCYRLVKK